MRRFSRFLRSLWGRSRHVATRPLAQPLEQLPDRINPATVDVTAGVLTFTDGGTENNNLTVAVSGSSYSFNDSLTNIVLGAGAKSAGWRGSGSKTVSGPASSVSGIEVYAGGGTNTVNVKSILDPIRIDGESGDTQVNLNSVAPTHIGNLANIQAEVTVNAGANTSLTASDYTGTSRANPVVISATGITGLAPHDIHLSGTFAVLKVYGSNDAGVAESFVVDAPDAVDFQLYTGGGADDVAAVAFLPTCSAVFDLGGGTDTMTIYPGVSVTGSVDGAETENFNTLGFGDLL